MYIKSNCAHFASSEQCVELHTLRHQVAQTINTLPQFAALSNQRHKLGSLTVRTQ